MHNTTLLTRAGAKGADLSHMGKSGVGKTTDKGNCTQTLFQLIKCVSMGRIHRNYNTAIRVHWKRKTTQMNGTPWEPHLSLLEWQVADKQGFKQPRGQNDPDGNELEPETLV